MIRKNIKNIKGTLKVKREILEGETIEQKISRIVNNKEPITDGAPIVYMERKDGVNPGFDVRTDRFDVAIDAMDIVSRSKIAKREERQKERESKDKPQVQGTEQSDNGAA